MVIARLFFEGCLLSLYLCSHMNAVAGQNLTIPSGRWRKHTSNLTRTQREGLAFGAAVPLSKANISQANPDLPRLSHVTSVYALLALQDYYSGNTTWRDAVVGGLVAGTQGRTGFYSANRESSENVNYWGLAFIYAFRAYKEQSLLEHAMDAWNLTYSSAYITPSAEVSDSGAGRNISFVPSASCSGGTFAGGVFSRQDLHNDTYINAVAVAPFMALSAYLSEETNNTDTAYGQAAQLSLNFIIDHLWNGTIVYDGIYSDSCNLSEPAPWTLNQAWFVEGLSVWANVTRNDTLTKLLETVVSSVATYPAWISSASDGIINDHTRDPSLKGEQQILKGVLVRGLAEARLRNPDTDLARYIEAFIHVQLNAILDFARGRGPNDSRYARSWDLSPASAFDAGGNVAAVDVLNSAFTLVSPSTFVNGTSKGHVKSPKTSAIAGGVVGGVVAAVVAVIAVTVLVCRRRRRTKAAGINNGPGSDAVEPFFSRIAHNPIASSKWGRINEAYELPSHPASLAPPASDANYDRGVGHEPFEVAEIPSIVQRSNSFLQGRHGEQPPRYEE
ncbi:hypothetical protein PENSPDRAFT_683186 [Peniophora sp. CONT]|nr:hypothetical protein PENSPDRAFT_683186 [Peniophora sp. CONT]